MQALGVLDEICGGLDGYDHLITCCYKLLWEGRSPRLYTAVKQHCPTVCVHTLGSTCT